jgi:hypothetical protein
MEIFSTGNERTAKRTTLVSRHYIQPIRPGIDESEHLRGHKKPENWHVVQTVLWKFDQLLATWTYNAPTEIWDQ